MKISFTTLLLILFAFNLSNAQNKVTISGQIKDKSSGLGLAYASVIIKNEKDSSFVKGTYSKDEGRFALANIKSGKYFLEITYVGYNKKYQTLFVGNLSEFLDIGIIELKATEKLTKDVEVTAKQETIGEKMDKKVFFVEDNISQSGGSVLQSLQNLPGVTIQDGKVQLRGNDKVAVLIDDKQSAITGFGSQSGLDNIPASTIEKIEIINNPSAKYDANGNAGIINIILKKNQEDGWNGKLSLGSGLGSLWERKENYPTVRPQYTFTPKINPSVSLNYKKSNINIFLQADNLYTETLNKNEFVTRTYNDGNIINHQLKRNRNTNFLNSKAGIDWQIDDVNTLTLSGMFGSEKIIDNGDQPFFNSDLSQRNRMWQFLEDELKTTYMATAAYSHKYQEAGHKLNINFNYTFHREDEKYFFDNILPTFTGKDAFKLISDEEVADLTLDYIKPLTYGHLETGMKLRYRSIPTNMQFIPGLNSPLDTNAGGWANYKELIPSAYANYIYEDSKLEGEFGLRVEYFKLDYEVNPNHNTYKSDGYSYTQPFPNVRLAYKFDDLNKISLFFNRRVDRPNEVDIRIFPKYDDAEIIKVGNPALKPQYTNSLELGFKSIWENGSIYLAAYHKITDGAITRISSNIAGSTLIYAVFQNVNSSYNSGVELVLTQDIAKWYVVNCNVNIYQNRLDAFSVTNKYPVTNTFSADKQELLSGNLKILNNFKLQDNLDAQLSAVYLAPDVIPQGRIAARFSLDIGAKLKIQNGAGEIYFNATDLLSTMQIKKTINGNRFNYISTDYYETQVIRLGYSYKF